MSARLAALAALLLAASAGAAMPPSPGEKPKLDCTRLVPTAVVARFFSDATLKPGMGDERTVLCNVSVVGNEWAAQASYLCRPTDTLAEFQERAAKAGARKPAIPGIGRGAFGTAKRLLFYDDDTDCMVDVSDNVTEKKAIELAKELAAVLKPDLLPKLDAGTFSLDCARLLPEPLLAKWMPGAKVGARRVQADQMECRVARKGGGSPVVVSYTCRGTYDARWWAQYKEQVKQNATEIADAGVGTGGVYANVFGMPSVNFADAETGCLVTVTAMGMDKVKALGFAAAVEEALTKESAR